MLSDQELMKVQETGNALVRPVTLLVRGFGGDDSFETNLLNVVRQIAGVSFGRVRMEDGAESPVPGKPCVTLSDGDRSNIHYLAAPEGPELVPFLDAIMWLGGAGVPPVSEAARSLDQLSAPSEILLLIASACPHCPVVVRDVLAMAVRQPLIKVLVADAMKYGDLAELYKVRSTPTVIINQGATLVGQATQEKIVRFLTDAENSLTEILGSMIKSGRAEAAGELLVRKRDPAAILPIFRAPEFSLRVGALVAMEQALEKDPRSLDPIVDALVELLRGDEATLSGDTAELLGKIGDARAVPALREAAQNPDPDVREAALEALELLG